MLETSRIVLIYRCQQPTEIQRLLPASNKQSFVLQMYLLLRPHLMSKGRRWSAAFLEKRHRQVDGSWETETAETGGGDVITIKISRQLSAEIWRKQWSPVLFHLTITTWDSTALEENDLWQLLFPAHISSDCEMVSEGRQEDATAPPTQPPIMQMEGIR